MFFWLSRSGWLKSVYVFKVSGTPMGETNISPSYVKTMLSTKMIVCSKRNPTSIFFDIPVGIFQFDWPTE